MIKFALALRPPEPETPVPPRCDCGASAWPRRAPRLHGPGDLALPGRGGVKPHTQGDGRHRATPLDRARSDVESKIFGERPRDRR